jgi:hypothetical protein
VENQKSYPFGQSPGFELLAQSAPSRAKEPVTSTALVHDAGNKVRLNLTHVKDKPVSGLGYFPFLIQNSPQNWVSSGTITCQTHPPLSDHGLRSCALLLKESTLESLDSARPQLLPEIRSGKGGILIVNHPSAELLKALLLNVNPTWI